MPATVGGDEQLRIFVALEVPDDVEEQILAWGWQHLADLRRPETLHVTLAFLGWRQRSDVNGVVGAVRAAASGATPFTLEPVRYRETRAVGMLVLADSSGRASALASDVQSRLHDLGLYEPEARPWLPHLTVARFRERPRRAPPLPAVRPFAPSGVAAFLSRLHPSGARYEVLESCPLGSVEPGG